MILEQILIHIQQLIMFIFDLFPNIPSVPVELSSLVDSFFDLIFDNAGIVGFFLPIDVVKIALPIAVIIIEFEHIYSLVMWVIKKIPMSIE